MRYDLVVFALLSASSAAASENYICKNKTLDYPVSFDRWRETLSIDRKMATVEHLAVASSVVEIRRMIGNSNEFFWAELDNRPQIIYMKDQKIIRTDLCRYVGLSSN